MVSLIRDWMRKAGTILLLTIAIGLSGQSIAFAAAAQAVLQGTADPSTVAGVVYFQETDAGLVIEASLKAPDGTRGFHIHEFGSCADMGNAAGGHYNPNGVEHGLLIEDGFDNAHAGDLGNVEVVQGEANYQAVLPGLTLTGSSYPIAGRAVILHEKPDDFGQPTGNAGGRVGCGTIAFTQSP